MRQSLVQNAFWRGLRDSSPFALVVAPFGALFGVVAVDAGLTLLQTMGFSVIVFAGASQFTALQLMLDQAPVIIVLISAIAVNLRMAMYSAALAAQLRGAPLWQRALVAYMNTDQTFAVAALEYDRNASLSLPERVAYFFGACMPIVPVWCVATYVGAIAGDAIPDQLGLEFAVPLAFLAMVAPALRTAAHVAAAVTSVVLAVLFAGLPYNLGLLPAGLGAMIVGAEVERRMGAAFRPKFGGK